MAQTPEERRASARESSRRWRERNPEKVREYSRQSYWKDPEKRREYQKTWRARAFQQRKAVGGMGEQLVLSVLDSAALFTYKLALRHRVTSRAIVVTFESDGLRYHVGSRNIDGSGLEFHVREYPAQPVGIRACCDTVGVIPGRVELGEIKLEWLPSGGAEHVIQFRAGVELGGQSAHNCGDLVLDRLRFEPAVAQSKSVFLHRRGAGDGNAGNDGPERRAARDRGLPRGCGRGTPEGHHRRVREGEQPVGGGVAGRRERDGGQLSARVPDDFQLGDLVIVAGELPPGNLHPGLGEGLDGGGQDLGAPDLAGDVLPGLGPVRVHLLVSGAEDQRGRGQG